MARNLFRLLLGITGGASLVAAIAFYFQWPLVADVWPWAGAYASLSPLSFYFLSSIAAAVGVPVVWIAATGRLHAAMPGAINLVTAFGPIAVFMFQGYAADPTNTRLLLAGLIVAASAVISLAMLLFGRRMPVRDQRALPRPARYSFVVFVTALMLVGGQLVLKTPNVLPWDISAEGSVVYGWIFLGASLYFLYAVVNPMWENAAGPLMGFLAYDVVLILPFIRHFADVRPEHMTSLILYMAVVTYSGLLAIYYLFINRETRIIAGAAAK